MHLRDLAERIARHEMGHYVVARLLSFKTGYVSIELTGLIDGHRGETEIILNEPIGTLTAAKKYLKRRMQVLYAGALAEALPPQQSPKKAIDICRAIDILENSGKGADQDNAKGRELLKVLRNLSFPEQDNGDEKTIKTQLQALNDEMWGDTIRLVQQHSDLIVGLGVNLFSRVKKVGEKAIITSSELDALPALKELKPIVLPAC